MPAPDAVEVALTYLHKLIGRSRRYMPVVNEHVAAARAAYDAAVANYRQTVLSAFQDVEDQLSAQRLLAKQVEAETAALKSARRTLEISTTKYKGGVITYLEVAIAQSSSLAHEQTVVQLNAQRLAATVSLIKALGAGWTTQEEKNSEASLRR